METSNQSNNYKRIKYLPSESSPNCSVFLAQEQSSGKIYIQKEVKAPSFELSKIYENEYLQSTYLNSNINFINIIDIFYSNDRQSLIIITEYIQSTLLKAINSKLKQKSYFSEYSILEFFTQICLCIKSFHDNNIIYRNIDPNKIYIANGNIVKVGDSTDIRSLLCADEKAITYTGFDLYLSPEILIGHPYSFKSDIWSLGVLLFHLMCLNYPFTMSDLSMMKNIKKFDKKKTLSKLPKHYSKYMKTLVDKLLNFEPLNRPDITTIVNYLYDKYFAFNSVIKIGYRPWITVLNEMCQKKLSKSDGIIKNHGTKSHKNLFESSGSIQKYANRNQKIIGLESTYRPNEIIGDVKLEVDINSLSDMSKKIQ